MPVLRRAVVAACLCVIATQTAFAWDDEGHMAVAYVAYKRLTDAARTRVDALLKLNPFYNRWRMAIASSVKPADRNLAIFMIAATWPDQIKSDPGHRDDGPGGGNRPPAEPEASRNQGYTDTDRHKYWHFINAPFSPAGLPLPAVPVPNAQERIAVFMTVLGSPTATDALKSYDLSWLLHLVGDIHQPLHASTRVTAGQSDGDNGGNSVTTCVTTACNPSTPLHSVWDDLLGTDKSVVSAMTAARQLPTPDATQARDLDPADWARESLALAKTDVYRLPIGAATGPFTLTQTYRTQARIVARARIALAGARLAAVLNRELAPALNTAAERPANVPGSSRSASEVRPPLNLDLRVWRH